MLMLLQIKSQLLFADERLMKGGSLLWNNHLQLIRSSVVRFIIKRTV